MSEREMGSKSDLFKWLLAMVIIYSLWISIIRGPMAMFVSGITVSIFAIFCLSLRMIGRKTFETGYALVPAVAIVFCSTFLTSSQYNNFLVVVPEKGGISEARVIKGIGLLTHPFSDKLVFIQREYVVEADVVINTDNGRTIIARSNKKTFRVMDPIAVYHRIGEKAELIETHLRDGVERCFYQEVSAKYFSNMLAKKTPDSFFIQSMPCGLGLVYYGFETVGGNSVSFTNFHLTDIAPINLQIE